MTAKVIVMMNLLGGYILALMLCLTYLVVYDSGGGNNSEDGGHIIQRKYWRTKGKILGRCVEMWDTFNGILDQGVSRNPDIDEDFMHTDL